MNEMEEYIYNQYAPQIEAFERAIEQAQQEIARLTAALSFTTDETGIETLWAERELVMERLVQSDARKMELEDALYLAIS